MRRSQFSALILSALTLAGCSSYKLGPVNGTTSGEKSIEVRPFENKTVEPYLTDAVTGEIRKRLQQDGTFRLDTHGGGDVILTGVVTHYDRTQMTVQPGDTFTVQDYNIAITAHIVARARATGDVILEKDVIGRIPVRVGNDLVSAERQNLPVLAEDLARKIVSLLAEGGW